jgi:predicted O-linked N-acetylglucosamine transferase (SPINDLY family)
MNALQNQLLAAQRARESRDYLTARKLYQQCFELAPRSGEIGLQVAICSLALREPAEALKYVRGASTPAQKARAALIEARAHRDLGNLDATHTAFEKGLAFPELTPDLARTAARALAELRLNYFGDPAGAAQVLNRHRAAVGDAAAAEGSLIAALYTGARPSKDLARDVAAHARQYIADPMASFASAGRSTSKTTGRGRSQRLRIGIVSPSLHASPVGFLTLGALTVLSESADLIFFDRKPKKDWLAEAFRSIGREWHAVEGLGATGLYDRLVLQQLDVLIDCGGWTDLDALRALSRRPAPKQLKWVGGQSLTTGLDCFDGFLADDWQIPHACEALYVEPILRFTGPYVTYYPPEYFDYFDAQKRSARLKPRARDGVFALVSNPAKISRATLDFLRKLKPKKLLLIDHRWRFTTTRARLEPEFYAIASDIEFVTPQGHLEYLTALRDTRATFVDTTPYSMGLSAIELLLMGKEIVSVPTPKVGIMAERHSFGHRHTAQFDDYATQAQELLAWCQA